MSRHQAMGGKESHPMVRSRFKGPLVMLVVLTGIAWGPFWSAEARGQGALERTFLLREKGQPERRCKILKFWTHTDGARVYEVQAQDTGELLTVVESGTTSAAGA